MEKHTEATTQGQTPDGSRAEWPTNGRVVIGSSNQRCYKNPK
jgi:hypothetical protein